MADHHVDRRARPRPRVPGTRNLTNMQSHSGSATDCWQRDCGRQQQHRSSRIFHPSSIASVRAGITRQALLQPFLQPPRLHIVPSPPLRPSATMLQWPSAPQSTAEDCMCQSLSNVYTRDTSGSYRLDGLSLGLVRACSAISLETSILHVARPHSIRSPPTFNSTAPWLVDEASAQQPSDLHSLSGLSSPSSSSHSSSGSLSPLSPHSPELARCASSDPLPPSSNLAGYHSDAVLLPLSTSAAPGSSSPPVASYASSLGGAVMWRCSLGCGQMYAKSSGRSIRKHFVACFRAHWPDAQQLADDAVDALISRLQHSGQLVTGLRKWEMRCASIIKTTRTGGKRQRSAEEQDSPALESASRMEDGSQLWAVEQQQRGRAKAVDAMLSPVAGGATPTQLRAQQTWVADMQARHPQRDWSAAWQPCRPPSAACNDECASSTRADMQHTNRCRHSTCASSSPSFHSAGFSNHPCSRRQSADASTSSPPPFGNV